GQVIGWASRSITHRLEHPAKPRKLTLNLTIDPTIAQIVGLRDLKAGWNTYGAGPVDEKVQRRAIDFASSFSKSSRGTFSAAAAVAPLANRGIALKWLTADREVDVRFFPDGGGDF